MLVFNKYLKELGYKKSDFPFDDKKDSRYSLDKKTGVVEAQTWNLYNTIILELYTYLRNFQENYQSYGTPMEFAEKENRQKEWHDIIEKIIQGLRAYVTAENLDIENYDYETYNKQKEELYKTFEEGWTLLGKYIGCLWW